MSSNKESILIFGTGNQAFKYFELLHPLHEITLTSVSGRNADEVSSQMIPLQSVNGQKYDYAIITGSEKDRLLSLKTALTVSSNILIEKPVSICVREYEDLIDLVKDKNVRVAFNRRFFHDYVGLRTLLSNAKFLGGIIQDQQSEHDFSERRLIQFDYKLTVANSIHSIDLLNFILNFSSDALSKIASNSNTNGMKYVEFQTELSNQVNYICTTKGPGPWSITLYYDKFHLYLSNHENIILRDTNRRVIFSSSLDRTIRNADLISMWNAFVCGSSDLPNISEVLNIHKLCMEIDSE